jgi:DnaK suppressor protein
MVTTIERTPVDVLSDERERLATELEELQRSRLEACPGDVADLADERMRLAQASRRVAAIEERLREVDAALERANEDRYGRCQVCRRRIAAARLEVLPSTTTCTKHAGSR